MKKKTHLVTLCYLLAGACLGMPVGAQVTPRIQFEKYTFLNGLEVILHEDHSTPIVAVDTWYHVGDRKTIEQGLKATNVGPITIRDMTGQLIH